MRALTLIVFVALSLTAQQASAANLSREDAVSRVQSAGFTLVSKTEPAPGAWDVWASKDGIAYEVKINADTGSVMATIPMEDND